MHSCPIFHARTEALEAKLLAYMRSHIKDVTPEVAASLLDHELLSVLESDELEIESEIQVFDIIQQRAAALSALQQPTDLECFLKVSSIRNPAIIDNGRMRKDGAPIITDPVL